MPPKKQSSSSSSSDDSSDDEAAKARFAFAVGAATSPAVTNKPSGSNSSVPQFKPTFGAPQAPSVSIRAEWEAQRERAPPLNAAQVRLMNYFCH
jgi:hypothetical protein